MDTTSRRVLVVDDEDVVCRSYERVLSEAGFDVNKAHSGPEALEKLEEGHYDVMLADLKMPGMSGIEVVEKLRETQPGMPVVLITGFPSQDTLEAAAKLHVADYLTKPIAPDVLTQATMQALTAPTWSQPAPYLQGQPGLGEARVPLAMPDHAMFGTEPTVAPARPQVVAPEPVAAEPVAPEAKQPSKLRSAAHLAVAPLIGLTYVVFLPVLGFALFIGLGAKAVSRKFSTKEA